MIWKSEKCLSSYWTSWFHMTYFGQIWAWFETLLEKNLLGSISSPFNEISVWPRTSRNDVLLAKDSVPKIYGHLYIFMYKSVFIQCVKIFKCDILMIFIQYCVTFYIVTVPKPIQMIKILCGEYLFCMWIVYLFSPTVRVKYDIKTFYIVIFFFTIWKLVLSIK